MNTLIIKFIPIVVTIFIGHLIRRFFLIKKDTINEFKILIINIGLPSILFLTFVKSEMDVKYLFLFSGIFIFCLTLFFIGIFFKKTKLLTFSFSPFFITGFEFGMIGVALFTSIFGIENLYVIALIALGHEVFIWFVYFPLLKKRDNISLSVIFISFLKSPIIFAIILAIFLNVTGLYSVLMQNTIFKGIEESLKLLSSIVVPLILLTVGYSINFQNVRFPLTFKYLAVRILVISILGSIFYFIFKRLITNLPPLFFYAYITFIILPPPFILPLFIKNEFEDQITFFNNSILIYTLLSFLVFFLFLLFKFNAL